MVAVWSEAKMPAVAEKVADVVVAGTVMVAGTERPVLLLERVTVAPPEGAALESVTEHAATLPAPRLAGLQVSELTTPGATSEMKADWGVPL
jgi:hypothetical protein